MIAVVIPTYKCKNQILSVLAAIDSDVQRIYVIDDACPEQTGEFVQNSVKDARVIVHRHKVNQGVGGAVMTGYGLAIEDGMDVIVKLDGDGQMDPALMSQFVRPILAGECDYTKGNRFYDIKTVKEMPKIRIFGNAVLSFLTKFSTGYWEIFDPTNGYTAIHARVAERLTFSKISHRYFFESDMLFRLSLLRAKVSDIAMESRYRDEVSNLKINKIIFEFMFKHIRNFSKRIFYNYYLRNFSIASVEIVVGLPLLLFGIIFGSYEWLKSLSSGLPASAGTVMVAALPIMIGVQLLLNTMSFDIAAQPKEVLHKSLARRKRSHKSDQ